MDIPGAGGVGSGELLLNRYRGSVWDDEKSVEMDRVDGLTMM